MGRSENPSNRELVERVQTGTDRQRVEAAEQLAERALGPGASIGPQAGTPLEKPYYEAFYPHLDLDCELAMELLDALDAAEPLVRGHVAGTLANAGPHVQDDPDPDALETVTLALLDAADDDDPTVRQSVMAPKLWTAVCAIVGTSGGSSGGVGGFEAGVLADVDTDRIAREASTVAIERLQDDRDVIRKRATAALASDGALAHDAELLLEHPSPQRAIEVVLDRLADPLGATQSRYIYTAPSPRDVAGSILVVVANREPALLGPSVERVRSALDAEQEGVRIHAAAALGRLAAHDPTAVEGLGEAVVDTLVQEGLCSPDNSHRVYAAWALGSLAGEGLLPAVTQATAAVADRFADAFDAETASVERYSQTGSATEPLVLLAETDADLAERTLRRVREQVRRGEWSRLERAIEERAPSVLDRLDE